MKVSDSTDNETPLLAGLCECSIGKGDIDGLVNATYFTCMPNLNAKGFVRSLASANDFPFAAIDCDGPPCRQIIADCWKALPFRPDA